MSVPAERARLVLVGGGVRCGKTAFALARARALSRSRYYLATARADDDEMRERIAHHWQERGEAFQTIEEPLDLSAVSDMLEADTVVVIDCLTLWLSNRLLAGDADDAIAGHLEDALTALRERSIHVVAVTNEVGLGLVPTTPLGRRFRDAAGWLHQRTARHADEIYFGALGSMLRLKPGPVELVNA